MNQTRRTAAALLGAAIFDVLPQAELFGGGETDTGFFYQFYLESAPVPETARMLEERMRLFLSENRAIREMEMTAYSARELFLSRGRRSAAELLEDTPPKDLVSMVKIGEFYDLAEGPFGTLPKDAFQILSIESMGDGEYQVEGCAEASKDELRAFLRKKAEYLRSNHLTVGSEKGFWRASPRGIVWLAAGLKAKRELCSRIEKEFCIGDEVAVQSPDMLDELGTMGSHLAAFWFLTEKTQNPEGNGGLFEECSQSTLEQILYCTEQDFAETQNSLLQRIDKTLIILGFPKGEKEGKRMLLEWTAEDRLGRSHVVIAVRTERLERKLVFRATLNVERTLALLLEKNKTG